jgi:hypothetical protein
VLVQGEDVGWRAHKPWSVPASRAASGGRRRPSSRRPSHPCHRGGRP